MTFFSFSGNLRQKILCFPKPFISKTKAYWVRILEWNFEMYILMKAKWFVPHSKHGDQILAVSSPTWSCCTYSKWVWGPRSWCRKCLTVRLVKSDWCLQPSQLLRRDEGKQVMQIGLETACWHLTSGMVIKNTLWQRQHLVVHSECQSNSSVVAY